MQPLYKVGDKLKDLYSGKEGIVTKLYLSSKDQWDDNKDTWYYSIDHMGWYYYPESELDLIEGA